MLFRSPRMTKRLNKELENALECHDPYIWYRPVTEDKQTWHFTIRGPKGSPFEGGVYHGRIELPDEYPIKAPDFYFLTENGRYKINTKICLNISGYHLEQWQPATTIDAMVRMIQAFMEDYSEAANGLGFIQTSVKERKCLAKLSRDFICPKCGKILDLMTPFP